MRILHLCSYSLYSGPLPGTLGLALAERQLGHTVHLAHDTKRGAFNDYEEAAAPWIEPHALAPEPHLTLSAKSTPVEYLCDLHRLRRLLRGGAIDVLHLHLSHDHGLAALAGRVAGVTVVRTMHAERSLERRFGQRWLNGRVDGFILRCEAHRRLLGERFPNASPRAVVIPGSIDAERFAPATAEARAAARVRFALPEGAPVLVHVGLIADRGQEELAAAVHRLKERAPHLLFVGRGEREQELKRSVDRLGIGDRVRFAGYLQGSELLAAYAAADAAFLAQPGNDAGTRAALEAMACGLPLIAIPTGALAELCVASTGFPVLERTPAAIAAAIESWLEDPGAGETRGRRACEVVKAERTFAREAELTVAFYERLAAASAHPRAAP